jgi:hypothetical protein
VADLLKQDDLQVVPGVLGVDVYANGEGMPVTAQRAAPLPVAQTWSYPAGPDVVGWQPVLSALSNGPATGPVGAGTLYAGYAPAGSFTVGEGGRAAVRRPAFGWAAQYAVAKGEASLSLSTFPYVPLAVLLELLAWAALVAALLQRPPRAQGATRTRGSAAAVAAVVGAGDSAEARP